MKLFNKPFCIFHHQNSQSISHRSVRIKSKENKKFASMIKRRIRKIREKVVNIYPWLEKKKEKWEKREKSLEEFSIFHVWKVKMENKVVLKLHKGKEENKIKEK